MNPRRVLFAAAAVALGILFTDHLIHELWLKSSYQAAASLWRTEADMKAHIPWMLGGQLLAAVAFTLIWVRIAMGGAELRCAVGFGLLIGLLAAANSLIFHAVQPIELHVIIKWIIGGFVQGAVLGIIAFYSYKPAKPCPVPGAV